MNRIALLSQRLAREGIAGFLITDLKNIRYLTGFTGSSAFLLVRGTKATFFTDSRYDIQARIEVGTRCDIHITKEGFLKELPPYLEGLEDLHFEPESLTYAQFADIKGKLGKNLVPARRVVYDMRRKKSPEEAQRISEAQAVTDSVFQWVLDNLEPGRMTEADLALEMDYRMRKLGAEGPAFSTIVASGPHSALPHAQPRNEIIGKNTVLLLDFGAAKNGYASDMTRTVWIGPKKPPADLVEVYNIVSEAQKRAIQGLKPGKTCREVDALARDFIKQKGHGDHFGHGLGHGVGLDVHEGPVLSFLSEDTLQGGEVVTVEPGIYLEGKFGVRIEDMLWVKDTGPTGFTGSPKDLLVL